jgi:hypothetical protein
MEGNTVFDQLSGMWPLIIMALVVATMIIMAIVMRPQLGVVLLIVAVVVGLFSYFAYFAYKDEKWREWANEHCTVIEKKDGKSSVGVGVSTGGQVGVFVSPTSGQTGYKCDDGITYWKNN